MTSPPSPFESLKNVADQGSPTDRARSVGKILEAIPALQHWLREVRQGAVQEMRSEGMSHAEVGKELGLSRARAQQIAEGRTTGKRADKKAESADDPA
jgi:hypothetical protein